MVVKLVQSLLAGYEFSGVHTVVLLKGVVLLVVTIALSGGGLGSVIGGGDGGGILSCVQLLPHHDALSH